MNPPDQLNPPEPISWLILLKTAYFASSITLNDTLRKWNSLASQSLTENTTENLSMQIMFWDLSFCPRHALLHFSKIIIMFCNIRSIYLALLMWHGTCRQIWSWSTKYLQLLHEIFVSRFWGSHISRHLHFTDFATILHFDSLQFCIFEWDMSLNLIVEAIERFKRLVEQHYKESVLNGLFQWGLNKRSATWSGDGKQWW